jgi:hypothetical protein
MVSRRSSASRPRRFSRRWLLSACGLALAFAVLPSSAQVSAEAPVTASALKAAFLYKFASYVEWPAQTNDTAAPITIGVAGADPFAAELTEITRGRNVAGRPISVRRFAAGDSFDGVQILFIGGQSRASRSALLESARSLPVLTVTESEGALADGSIINFRQDRDRVRFEISLYAAEQSRLKMNSRLLAVADAVRRGPE